MREVKRISRDLAYQGKVIDVYVDTVKVPNGNIVKWDYIDHVGAAAVVPVMPDGRILMVRQFRNAVDRFTLEIPAGKRKTPEEPMAVCAARELEEEMGYRSDDLEELITVNTTVAFCNEKIGIFVARNLKLSHQNLDEDEDVEAEYYTVDELCDMIFRQELTDSKTVAGILAYRARYGG